MVLKRRECGLARALVILVLATSSALPLLYGEHQSESDAMRTGEVHEFSLTQSFEGRDYYSSSTKTAGTTKPSSASSSSGSASDSAELPSEFTPKDMLAIPAKTTADAFSLNPDSEPPTINPLAREKLATAAEAIEKYGPCGFVFLDLQTGLGIAHNAGQEVYTASSSKAVVTLYALLQSRKTGVPLPDWERENIESAITVSSNEAFDAFGFKYLTADYTKWLADHKVAYDQATYGLYMNASARSVTSLWDEVYLYLAGGGADAKWFSGLLAKTNRSFIRDGLEGTGADVRNKAGWIAGGPSCTCDAGIIEHDSRSYLMVILTGQPNTVDAQNRVSALAKLLFEQRKALKG